MTNWRCKHTISKTVIVFINWSPEHTGKQKHFFGGWPVLIIWRVWINIQKIRVYLPVSDYVFKWGRKEKKKLVRDACEIQVEGRAETSLGRDKYITWKFLFSFYVCVFVSIYIHVRMSTDMYLYVCTYRIFVYTSGNVYRLLFVVWSWIYVYLWIYV